MLDPRKTQGILQRSHFRGETLLKERASSWESTLTV